MMRNVPSAEGVVAVLLVGVMRSAAERGGGVAGVGGAAVLGVARDGSARPLAPPSAGRTVS